MTIALKHNVRHVRLVTDQDQTSTVTECSYTDFTFRAVQSEYESLVPGKGGVYLCLFLVFCVRTLISRE